MVVSSVENTSKAEAAIPMPMHTPFTRITTSLSTSKPPRYVSPNLFSNPIQTISKVYVLPDGYPVSDPSLDDISYVLAPSFSPAQISTLSSPSHLLRPSYDLSSKPYLPGYIGLNNIKHNDHMNVIIHSLLHIPPLRDSLLISNFTPQGKETELVKRFAGLAKKVWNPRLFKSQVSPHEFLQEVNRASAGKFRLEQQGDPVEFLGWLLNRLHKDMGGTKKRNSSEFTTSSRVIL
jgi:U4/U6.U5 tri-snRNP-associated protein 2